MKWLLVGLPFLLAGLVSAAGGEREKKYETVGKILRLDRRLDKLVPKDAKLEKLAGGFKWTEGPVWVKDGGYLLFSDIPNNVINKWKEGEGITKFIHPAGYTGKKVRAGTNPGDEPGTNGLRIDAMGRLVACEHGQRRVSRLDLPLDGSTKPMIGAENIKKTLLADRYMGKRLNSPNDLIYSKNGALYFTDPPYGMEKGWDDPARELDFCGVYRLTKGGTLELLTKEMTRPNGIALSPDEKTLYVANSDPKEAVIMAFPFLKGGKLGKGRVFFDTTKWVGNDQPGLPDGLKVDTQGNLWATGPGGVHILTPEGTRLGTIVTGVPTANCAFGDDGSTLYVAANHDLCRIRTTVKGMGF